MRVTSASRSLARSSTSRRAVISRRARGRRATGARAARERTAPRCSRRRTMPTTERRLCFCDCFAARDLVGSPFFPLARDPHPPADSCASCGRGAASRPTRRCVRDRPLEPRPPLSSRARSRRARAAHDRAFTGHRRALERARRRVALAGAPLGASSERSASVALGRAQRLLLGRRARSVSAAPRPACRRLGGADRPENRRKQRSFAPPPTAIAKSNDEPLTKP